MLKLINKIPQDECFLEEPKIIINKLFQRDKQTRYVENLSDRDNYVKRIEKQIKEKRQMLINQREYLNNIGDENEYLEGVRNDYIKYNNHIVKQKEDQINAMSILNHYIEDLKLSGKLTEQDIEDTRKEQQEILDEIDIIKMSLDELI
jgi:hypothetical protein